MSIIKIAEEIKQSVIPCLRNELSKRGFSDQENETYCETYKGMLEYPVLKDSFYIDPSVEYGERLLKVSSEESALKECLLYALLGEICTFLPDTDREGRCLRAVSYESDAVRIYENDVAGTDMEDAELASKIYMGLNIFYGWLADMMNDHGDRWQAMIEYGQQAVWAEEKAYQYEPRLTKEYLAGDYKNLGLLYKDLAERFLGKAEHYVSEALALYSPLEEEYPWWKHETDECTETLDAITAGQAVLAGEEIITD